MKETSQSFAHTWVSGGEIPRICHKRLRRPISASITERVGLLPHLLVVRHVPDQAHVSEVAWQGDTDSSAKELNHACLRRIVGRSTRRRHHSLGRSGNGEAQI